MSRRLRKILLLSLAVLMLPGIRLVHRELNTERGRLGLTHTEPLENAPPALAFTTVALGGFRGLMANYLWSRSADLQEAGDYFEAISLSDWITKLQPDNGTIWAQQAWNLTYNISVQFPDPRDRWLWIQSGISLLRDQGLHYNPDDVDLFRELAWFFQDKIGSLTDYENNYFKTTWASEMADVLGTPPNLDALLNPKTDDELRRARILRERYKLDPARMKRVDEQYGPFDWRLPEAHAIYWADLGLEKCQHQDDRIKLRQVIWQSMEKAVQKGRLVINYADRRLEFAPNLDMIPNANRAYDEMKQQEPDKVDYINRGQKNFLKDVVCFFYTHNRVAEAAQWFGYTKTNFPDAIPANAQLDEYVIGRVTESVDQNDAIRVNALVEGLLGLHFYNLAIGEDDQANGYALLARRVWERFQQKFSDPLHRGQRGLPSMAELQKNVLAEINRGEHGFSPALLAQLRAQGGWPADTNAPAVSGAQPGQEAR